MNYFSNGGSAIFITPFLNITEVFNNGISFGAFHGMNHSNLIFSLLSSSIALFFTYEFLQETWHIRRWSFALIIAGAIGNLLDRLIIDAVFDFIDFHINSWHFATFNLADAFVSIGALLLCCSYILKD